MPAPAREATSEAVKVRERRGGSLTRRMIVVAAIWISLLLLIGGYALDRVLARGIVQNFDQQLEYVLNAMIAASEIGPDGEVRFTRPPADQRFLEPYSGAYFQISGQGAGDLPIALAVGPAADASTSAHHDVELHKRDSYEFEGEPLRILERDVIAAGIDVRWRFQVAQSREAIDGQIRDLRSTLVRSFAALGAWPARPGRAAGLLRAVAAAPRAARSGRDPRRHARPALPRISRARSSRWSRRSTSCWPIARRRRRKRGATPAISPMR